MLAVLLLMSMLAPQAAQVPVPTRDAAAALARDGQYEAALVAFRQIAAADPRDHEARLWIARLHGWMGHPEQAQPVYHSIMLEDPANLEAMLGAGLTLVTLGDVDQGLAILRRAETAQPQHPEVLAALGRAYTLAGDSDRAVVYAERAMTTAPSEANRLALEQARVLHGHRLELTSFGEDYSTGISNTGSVELRFNYRLHDRLRLVGRGQHQRKFGFSEQRGGGGLEWWLRPQTSLFGQVLVGPEDNIVLPRVDVQGEIAHTHGPAQWTAGYRFFDFPSAQVSAFSPGVTWWPTDRVSFGARYSLLVSEFPTLIGRQSDHAVSLRTGYRLMPRLWASGGYAFGAENLETLSPDRVGDFDAHTVSGGLRYDLPTLTSIVGGYEYQWRPRSIEMQRLTLSLLQRF